MPDGFHGWFLAVVIVSRRCPALPFRKQAKRLGGGNGSKNQGGRFVKNGFIVFKSHYSVASVLKTFLANTPEKPLAELKTSDIHTYTQTRLKAGIRPGTINRELSVISATINHAARRWGVPLTNPVRYQWLKPDPPRLRYLTRQEAACLIAQAQALRQDLADFIRLALHTGCRKNELLTLKWSDVHIDRRVILLRPEQTKANKRRAVPLNQTALQALDNLRQQNDTQWVFARRKNGKPGERIKALDWLFRKAVKQAGIEDFRIHDLRHTFASWLVSEGVELVKVRDLLGHTSIKMTERYAHLMPDRLLDAVQILDFPEAGK